MSNNLWTEKYRPKTVDEYVWKDEKQKQTILNWVKNREIPNTLFSGGPGTGKTSAARLMMLMSNVNPGDILEINASRERKVDDINNLIQNFASTWPIGDMKYIILDEADSLTPLAQRSLRNTIETYSSICRFIFTCNYQDKIIPALHSRLQTLTFSVLDKDEFTRRVIEILLSENVDVSSDDAGILIEQYVNVAYPDLRKCINLLQQNTIDNSLLPFAIDEASGTKDYLTDVVSLFMTGQLLEARKLIISQVSPEEYEDFYRWLYQNLNIWGEDQSTQNEALLIIRKGLVNHALIADAEINLSATLVELGNLMK